MTTKDITISNVFQSSGYGDFKSPLAFIFKIPTDCEYMVLKKNSGSLKINFDNISTIPEYHFDTESDASYFILNELKHNGSYLTINNTIHDFFYKFVNKDGDTYGLIYALHTAGVVNTTIAAGADMKIGFDAADINDFEITDCQIQAEPISGCSVIRTATFTIDSITDI